MKTDLFVPEVTIPLRYPYDRTRVRFRFNSVPLGAVTLVALHRSPVSLSLSLPVGSSRGEHYGKVSHGNSRITAVGENFSRNERLTSPRGSLGTLPRHVRLASELARADSSGNINPLGITADFWQIP